MRWAGLILTASVAAGAVAPVWTPETSGVTARLRGVSAASGTVAWTSGSASTVLHTADGGATWQKQAVTSDRVDFRDIDAVSPSTAYALSIGAGPLSRIYKTTDAGVTWTAQFAATDAKVFLDAMTFWDASHGVVAGDSSDGQFYLLTTADGGRTWTRVPATALPPALPNEGAFAASGTNIAVVGHTDAWFGTGAAAKARVLHTHDRGKTWQVFDTPLAAGPSSGIFSVAFRDARHGVIVGGDYSKERDAVDNCAVTSDGGVTWTLVRGLSGFRSAVAYVPGAKTPTLIAVGPAGSDLSVDDGRTWAAVPGPGFDTISFAPGLATAWASGNRGALARLTVPR